MFRSSQPPNPLDDVVTKATDANLTTENWEFIMDACDKVNDDPENGSKNAVDALSKRLAIQNANVQLFALTLLGSMAQNCGSKMQREIASKKFTDLLLRLSKDKSVHRTVKTKIAEVMSNLSQEFKSDPSLKVMSDAYNKLMKDNPTIQPPDKPQKHQMTDLDRQKEEEELQMVLALSLSEVEQPNMPGPINDGYGDAQHASNTNTAGGTTGAASGTGNGTGTAGPGGAGGKTAATVTRVRALYDLNSSEEGELSFRKGDIIHVIESVYRDWWRGSLRGEVGIFPLNYVTPVPDPTPEELKREAEDEVKVFSQSRNIEKLLALLSSVDQRDGMVIAENEELQNLYHTTLAIRPKLVKLIDKYSQKKDDLIRLNDKFINARRIYDHLMESSLAQYRTTTAAPTAAPITAPYSTAPNASRTSISQPPYPMDLPSPYSTSQSYQQPPVSGTQDVSHHHQQYHQTSQPPQPQQSQHQQFHQPQQSQQLPQQSQQPQLVSQQSYNSQDPYHRQHSYGDRRPSVVSAASSSGSHLPSNTLPSQLSPPYSQSSQSTPHMPPPSQSLSYSNEPQRSQIPSAPQYPPPSAPQQEQQPSQPPSSNLAPSQSPPIHYGQQQQVPSQSVPSYPPPQAPQVTPSSYAPQSPSAPFAYPPNERQQQEQRPPSTNPYVNGVQSYNPTASTQSPVGYYS